jgi:LysM repeat protein
MVAKNLGRYLAPVTLIVVAIAVALVVRDHVVSHHSVAAPRAHQLPVSRDVAPKRRFYVIKPGDSLSTISVKTRVPIATLEALNPSVDPNALQTGQRIRLRR